MKKKRIHPPGSVVCVYRSCCDCISTWADAVVDLDSFVHPVGLLHMLEHHVAECSKMFTVHECGNKYQKQLGEKTISLFYEDYYCFVMEFCYARLGSSLVQFLTLSTYLAHSSSQVWQNQFFEIDIFDEALNTGEAEQLASIILILTLYHGHGMYQYLMALIEIQYWLDIKKFCLISICA